MRFSKVLLFAAVLAAGLVGGYLLRGGGSTAGEHRHEQGKVQSWTCSMHPEIRETRPGKCRKCGMDLVPVRDDEDDPGPRRLAMSESAKKLAEIVTAPVERRHAAVDVRMVGKVVYDENAGEDDLRLVPRPTRTAVRRLHGNPGARGRSPGRALQPRPPDSSTGAARSDQADRGDGQRAERVSARQHAELVGVGAREAAPAWSQRRPGA